MNFLIQGTNGCPDFDFGWELIKSIEFQNKELNENRSYFIRESPICTVSNYETSNWCPIGSVEFVHKWFELNNIPIPKPINIPYELFRFSGLHPIVQITEDIDQREQSVFIKNFNEIKHPDNGVTKKIPKGTWQITDYIKDGFDSEWRCFIFNGKLLDVKQYAGNWNSPPPEEDYIQNAIKRYKSAPCCWTLDIGLKESYSKDWYDQPYRRDEHYIIEVHNFYSCGLYGFSNRFKLPQMFAQWYSEWLRKEM